MLVNFELVSARLVRPIKIDARIELRLRAAPLAAVRPMAAASWAPRESAIYKIKKWTIFWLLYQGIIQKSS